MGYRSHRKILRFNHLPTIEIKDKRNGRTVITFDGFEKARKKRLFGTLQLLNKEEAFVLLDDIREAISNMSDEVFKSDSKENYDREVIEE